MSGEAETQIAFSRKPVTLREAIKEAAGALSRLGIESAKLDAEVLLAEALGATKDKLYLDYERPLDDGQEERLYSLIRRRTRGEPVAYITGRREFWSLDFLVTPAVLVPRPETELLVEVAVGLIEAGFQMADRKLQILDLGTGSGAIAVSLARELGGVEIWASDVSREALEIAQANALRHDAHEKVRFVAGDLFEAVRDRRGYFQVIVSNPPYIRRGEFDALAREIRDFEPRIALDGGLDGLDFYRRIIQEGRIYLAPGGFMALEIGEDMGEDVARLFADAGGYTQARLHVDYAGRDRVVSARKLKVS